MCFLTSAIQYFKKSSSKISSLFPSFPKLPSVKKKRPKKSQIMLSSERGYFKVFPVIQYCSSSYLCKSIKSTFELGCPLYYINCITFLAVSVLEGADCILVWESLQESTRSVKK